MQMNKSELTLEQYYEDVFRFLRGISAEEQLAEELTQETFYRALKSIETYRGDTSLRVWLCAIAKNLFYTHCKKQARFTAAEYPEAYEANEHNLIEIISDKETALQIHKILHHLQEPYKEIFSLRVFGELSFQEIGELFGKSAHWACVTYHRAKEMIQAKMNTKKGDHL